MTDKTPIDRMRVELQELTARLEKLRAFIAKGQPSFLTNDEWAALPVQERCMSEYQAILEHRIKLAQSK